MNTSEFSVAFDVYYNNITSNQAPGLNEYEKSMFLTQAQNQLVREYFNQRIDQAGGGYDGNEKRQYDFSCLTKHAELTMVNPDERFDQRSLVYQLPQDWFLTLNEQINVLHTETSGGSTVTKNKLYTVLPISMDEYDTLMSKPYKYPNKNQAWRLLNHNEWVNSVYNTDTEEYEDVNMTSDIEVIMKDSATMIEDQDIIKYRMRYVKKPYPIILEVLTSYSVSIDGETQPLGYNALNTTWECCELPEVTHKEILERAVVLAKSMWIANTQQQNNQRERSDR